MSKPSCTPHRTTRKSKKRVTASAAASTSSSAPAPRRRSGGIDFRPAFAAARDLAVWAFGLAAREVADSPEGRRRVRIARQFVLANLHGERPAVLPTEELMFTMSLLARIFEMDKRLPASEVVSLCQQIRIATDLVPLMLHAQSAPSAPHAPWCAPTSPPPPPPPPPSSPITPLRPRPGTGGIRSVPAGGCNECAHSGLRIHFAA